MGIWNDLWSDSGGGGGQTQELYNQRHDPPPTFNVAYVNRWIPNDEPVVEYQVPSYTPSYTPGGTTYGEYYAPGTSFSPDRSHWADKWENRWGNGVQNDVIDWRSKTVPVPDYYGTAWGTYNQSPNKFMTSGADDDFGSEWTNPRPTSMDLDDNGLNDQTGYANGVVQDFYSPTGFSFHGLPTSSAGAPYSPTNKFAELYSQDPMRSLADPNVPDQFGDDYNAALIARNHWTPDQAREQFDSQGHGTLQDYYDLSQKEYQDWQAKKQEQEIAQAAAEHDRLTPDFASLQEAQDRLVAGGYSRREVEMLPDQEVFDRAALMDRVAAGRASGVLGTDVKTLGSNLLFGGMQIPGGFVGAGLNALPEGIGGVPNPLANDAFSEIAQSFVNIGVGAMLGGWPGAVAAFGESMAPSLTVDPATKKSAWDQMDWKQRAFVTGQSVLNAGLLTKGDAFESWIGRSLGLGEGATAKTAAGVAVNAAIPVLSGSAQAAIGEDVDWTEVAKQAAIWGGVRGAFGIIPVAREQIRAQDERTFNKAFDWLDEEARFRNARDVTPPEPARIGTPPDFIPQDAPVPANAILIPKIASEMRGETPGVALRAIERVASESPETAPSLALTVKVADRLKDVIRPITTAEARPAPGMANLTEGLTKITPVPASPEFEGALQGVLDAALEVVPFEPLRESGFTAPPPERVLVDSANRAPLESHPFDLAWTDIDGNIRVNPRAALGEAQRIIPNPEDSAEVAKAAAGLTHSGILFEYGRSRSMATVAGEKLAYAADFVFEAMQTYTPSQIQSLTEHYQSLLDQGVKPAPVRTSASRMPQNFTGADAAVFGNSFIDGAREIAQRPYSQPVLKILGQAINDLRDIPAALMAGVNPNAEIGGLTLKPGLFAEFISPVDRLGGSDGRIYFNPHEIVTAVNRYGDVPEAMKPKVLAQIITHTAAHELSHSAESLDFAHSEAFNRALAIFKGLGNEDILRVADTIERQLREMPPEAMQELFNDAARATEHLNYDADPNRATIAGQQRPVRERGVREPVRGPEAGILQRGDGDVLPPASPPARDVARGSGDALREGAPASEPERALLPRTDEPATAPDRGIRSASRDGQLQRESEATPPAEDVEDVDLYKSPRTEKTKFKQETRYPHNRSEGMTRRRNKGSQYQDEEAWREQESKKRGWDTAMGDTGSARATYAIQLSSMLAGAAYGYSEGDTKEERLWGALAYGFGGLIIGNGLVGGPAWYLRRRAMGKFVKEFPDATRPLTETEQKELWDTITGFTGDADVDLSDVRVNVSSPETATRTMKQYNLEQAREILGQFTADVGDVDLGLLTRLWGLNAEALENQRALLAGVQKPYEAITGSLKEIFATPAEGSIEETIKHGQQLIIGHWQHVVDKATTGLMEMYKLVEGKLDTPDKRMEFVFAFEDPLRFANYWKRNEGLAPVAFALSKGFAEWGKILGELGMIDMDTIQDPKSWRENSNNYFTHFYERLSPNDKLFIVMGRQPSFSTSMVENARHYTSIADAVLDGKVVQDINPVGVLGRYMDVVGRRAMAAQLQAYVTELSEFSPEAFLPESLYNEYLKSPQDVLKLKDYELIDSPLMRNRVDPQDVSIIHDAMAAVHRLDVDMRRWERLAGLHGRKAKDAENRAFAIAKRIEPLERQLLDKTATLEERIAARDAIVTELSSGVRTTLDDIRRAANERGRTGLESRRAAQRFAASAARLDRAVQAFEETTSAMTPETIEEDALGISNIKEEMLRAAEDARSTLAEEREPEVGAAMDAAYEEAADLYDLKEAKKKAAAAARAAETETINSFKAEWQKTKRTSKYDHEISDIQAKVAIINGRLQEADRMIQFELRKAVGAGGKTPGHEELAEAYQAWADQARKERLAILDSINSPVAGAALSVRDRIRRDSELLYVHKTVAPMFRWTERSAYKHGGILAGKGNLAGFMDFHGRWKQTLLSGFADLYLIGAHTFTHASKSVFQISRMPENARNLKEAYSNAFLASLSPTGNAEWRRQNDSWIHFLRTHGLGVQSSSNEIFQPIGTKKPQTLLSFIPGYETMVGAMDRAQFDGMTYTLKVNGARQWFLMEMDRQLHDPEAFGLRMEDILRKKGYDLGTADDAGKSPPLGYPSSGEVAFKGEVPTEDVIFDSFMEALTDSGISQIEIDRAARKATRLMDEAYGGMDPAMSGIGSTQWDTLRLLFLAPNWLITRMSGWLRAGREIAATPVQMAESVKEMTFNAKAKASGSEERYQRRTSHPFDLHTQSGKEWALGTISMGIISLFLGAVGYSVLDQSMKNKKLSGPDMDYVLGVMKDALTDPTHFLEIRDPWTGQYWTPFTWQKDVFRVAIAAYYLTRPFAEGRVPNEEDYNLAWETVGSYAKARFGPLPRTLWNVFLGTNFAGKAISDSTIFSVDWTKDQFINFFKENQPQFASEAEKSVPLPGTDKTFGELTGQGYSNPLFSLFNMLGIGRGRTQTPLDKEFRADQMATDGDGNPLYPELKGATNYATLEDPNAKAAFLDRHPDVREYLRGGLPSNYREVSDEVKANIKAKSDLVVTGKDESGKIYYFSDYRDDVKMLNAESRGASKSTFDYGERKNPSRLEGLIDSYYDLFDKTSVNGVLDGDAFNDAFAEWAKDKSEDDIAYVFRASQIGDPPPLQEYARAIIELKRIGAFDMPRHDPDDYKSGKTEDEVTSYINDAKQKLLQSDPNSSLGFEAIARAYYEEKGLPWNRQPPKDDMNFLHDIKLTMGDPSDEYKDFKDKHKGLFAWIAPNTTYETIRSMMEATEDPEVVKRVYLDE